MTDSQQSGSGCSPIDDDESKKSQMEQMVSSYDSYMNEATYGRDRELRDATVDLAHVTPGDHVLEVGCGTGTLALAAKRRVGPSGKVFGIDILPGMVEVSRRKAALTTEDVVFQLGSIDDIPFADSLFDVVLCSFMIFHMSEETRRKGVREIHRVLKSGGRLLVLDVAPAPQPEPPGVTQESRHDLGRLVPLLVAAGFSKVEILPVEFRVQGVCGLAAVHASLLKS